MRNVDQPLIETTQEGDEDLLDETLDRDSVQTKISKMSFTQRLKAATKGTAEMRAILVRDTNKMIAAAVMSSPKLTEQEIETFSRMGSVSEDILRIIAHNRKWMKSYKIMLGLVQESEDAGRHQHEPAAAHPAERAGADGDRSEYSRAAPDCGAEEGPGEPHVTSAIVTTTTINAEPQSSQKPGTLVRSVHL